MIFFIVKAILQRPFAVAQASSEIIVCASASQAFSNAERSGEIAREVNGSDTRMCALPPEQCINIRLTGMLVKGDRNRVGKIQLIENPRCRF
jgi:hypothetical protein